VLAGDQALEDLVAGDGVDTVMAAIVGAAGLASCLAAARAGKRLLLANKEALVVGATCSWTRCAAGGATLLPIDSEHSAIFQSLPEDPSTWPDRVDRIILTASGGPFRTRDPASLRDVTPEQACAHPNWVMGRKISVDSATMMNKALEVIEARYLFGLAPDRCRWSSTRRASSTRWCSTATTSVVAQLGTPDMRVPIAYGLAWPERIESGAAALDFSALADMSFESFDSRGHRQRFPGTATGLGRAGRGARHHGGAERGQRGGGGGLPGPPHPLRPDPCVNLATLEALSPLQAAGAGGPAGDRRPGPRGRAAAIGRLA
jgi:1-deoxy-D-xylulose-5-phosphate reductoisomerase